MKISWHFVIIVIEKVKGALLMKNFRRAIWGLIFVAAAVVIALNSFDIIDFNIFFEGWWTLFIIVPSFAGLITDRDKSGSIFGLCL